MTEWRETGEPGVTEQGEPGEQSVTDPGVAKPQETEELRVVEPASEEEEFHPQQDADSADSDATCTNRRKKQTVSIIKHELIFVMHIFLEQKAETRKKPQVCEHCIFLLRVM